MKNTSVTTSWLTLTPVCNGFAYNAAMICEGCAAQTIEHLQSKGDEDSDDSYDFPQGPYTDHESDSPRHCDNGARCVNAVQIPGGNKVGCPIACSLTQHGIETTRRSIAEHIIFGSAHQKAVGRLWWHLFQPSLEMRYLIRLNYSTAPLPPPLKKALSHHASEIKGVLREIFTDLGSLYGGAVLQNENNDALILWKLTIDDSGRLDSPSTIVATVRLPSSELQERPLEDMLNEAVSEGAWD